MDAGTAELTGDVIVIGAGPAGLAAGYYLERAGIDYLIVERTDQIGSTWAGLYPTLRLNTASFVSHLPGRRIPLRYGIYMLGRDFYAYLVEYARQYPLKIRFRVEVTRVTPRADGWWVETNVGARWYPCVIVASGRFSKPYLPDLPGMATFDGQILHARDYHGPEPFAGQRVLVAGSGPSGTDIAVELQHTAARPVLLSVRSDIVIARRYPYGLPDTAWQLLARMFLPRRWRKPVLDRIVYQGYHDAADLGLKLAPNRTDRRGTSAPVRGRALIDAIHSGAVRPVAGIAAFGTSRCVELLDGSRVEADVVILSTGYRPAIDYLDFDYETDIDGWPVRISSAIEGGWTEVKDHPGLYLVGRYYRGLGPLNNIRNEARTAVREIRNRLTRLTPVRSGAP
jgi:cation diffusion facilitator CzcD-associated flavoprotein CzcO